MGWVPSHQGSPHSHPVWRLGSGASFLLESRANVITQKSFGLAVSLGFRHYSWPQSLQFFSESGSSSILHLWFHGITSPLSVLEFLLGLRWSRVIISMTLNSSTSSNFAFPWPSQHSQLYLHLWGVLPLLILSYKLFLSEPASSL